MSGIKWMALGALAVLAAGCGASAGVGYSIPGTPVSVGVSVPLDQRGKAVPAKKIVYRQVQVETVPPGAQVLVNQTPVGSTPMLVTVPFERGWFGRARGTAHVMFRKGGYLDEGMNLFPAGSGVSRAPGSPPLARLSVYLRPQ